MTADTDAKLTAASGGAVGRTLMGKRFSSLLAREALLAALVVEVIVFVILTPDFATFANFRDIATQGSIIALVAVPWTALLLTGYVDLSVGSTVALAAVTAGVLMRGGHGPLLAIIAAVVAGLIVGVINGTLVAGVGFSAIIVTLGGLTAIRGIAESITTETPAGFGPGFAFLGQGRIVGIPVPVWITLIAFLIGGFVIKFSVWGRHIYAIGVNPSATYLSGVSVRKLPFALFSVVGAAAGLGGAILASRIDASPADSIGNGFELDVMTAILLGGVSFGGGRGRLIGVLFGLLFLAFLQNGLTLLNVSSTGSMVAKGLVLVVAAGLERFSSRRAPA